MTTVNVSYGGKEISQRGNRRSQGNSKMRYADSQMQPGQEEDSLITELRSLNEELKDELRKKFPRPEDQKYLGIYQKPSSQTRSTQNLK
ncbi:hypothetical protein M9Y10_037989 [Tritrichomonas musculus]|uniref:Uncharacterized protein n=1 Tax=Tritrichomonas musculus TaxID=1915356 RepID=A0ABR2K7A7_9EUKA